MPRLGSRIYKQSEAIVELLASTSAQRVGNSGLKAKKKQGDRSSSSSDDSGNFVFILGLNAVKAIISYICRSPLLWAKLKFGASLKLLAAI